MHIFVAITGASGTIYAARLLQKLVAAQTVSKISVAMTLTAEKVATYELGKGFVDALATMEKVMMLDDSDYFHAVASGSSDCAAMVVVPCSMGTLARIATGVSTDLISRAADVALKERRPLIIVPREAPLSLIHLRNMTSLTEAGATVIPASPSFYSKPKTIEALVDTVVERVVLHLNVEASRYSWRHPSEK